MYFLLFIVNVAYATTIIIPPQPRVNSVYYPQSSYAGAPLINNQLPRGGTVILPVSTQTQQVRPTSTVIIPASRFNSQQMLISSPSGVTNQQIIPASTFNSNYNNQQFISTSPSSVNSQNTFISSVSPTGTTPVYQSYPQVQPVNYGQSTFVNGQPTTIPQQSTLAAPVNFPVNYGQSTFANGQQTTIAAPVSHGAPNAGHGGQHSSDGHFSYEGNDGPTHWYEHYPECGGKKQSPINIDSNQMVASKFNDLIWTNYWVPAEYLIMENNGHTMEINGKWRIGGEPTVSGGPLIGEYVFKQLHFHWGLEYSTGSEHKVNNQSFPMEMHAVHWKKQYGTYEQAIKNSDGLAVMGYFWVVGQEPNYMLESFIKYLPYIKGSNNRKIQLPKAYPLDNLDLTFNNQYVTYPGSLTTPPCSEIVTWIINSRPLTLSAEQLHRMRTTVQEDNHNIHNYRPAQPLNGRSLQFAV